MARSRRFLAHKVPVSSTESVSDFCSGDGEGKFRADPKTYTFSSRTGRTKPAPGSGHLGPGAYSVETETVNTRSDWSKSSRFSNVVGSKSLAEQQAMPGSTFTIQDEDARTWNRYKVDPSLSMRAKMGSSFSFEPKRFYNPASGVSTNVVGPGDYDAQSVKSDRRNPRRPSSTQPESSFVSKTQRFEDPASGVTKNELGPGQYGIPKGTWEWMHGTNNLNRPSASFVKSRKLKPRKRHVAALQFYRDGDTVFMVV